MASHFQVDEAVENAIATMRQQAHEIFKLRMELIKARSLVGQAEYYVRLTEKRWEDAGIGGQPATSVRQDIEKFLEVKP